MPRENLIKLRKGTSTQWNESNPVLDTGEPGYDSTNKILKIGDGSTNWSTLDFVAAGSQVNQYESISNFPSPGAERNIYISMDTNRVYRWDGTYYIEVGSGQ